MTAETVIQAEALERDYRVKRGMFSEGLVRAVAGVSFTLETGKTLAVVGESGCGKSTLARLVTLIEPPTAGRLEIGGLDVGTAAAHDLRALRKTVQIVFQDPYGSLNPRKRVGTILEEPVLINTDMDAAARRKAAMEMMERVGLRPEHYDRYPHMFSGGQRQRIAVARALMLNPKVVVLDEPVSALDVSIQAQVLNLLGDLQRDFNLAYLFISHDLSVVRHIADDVLVMYLGRPVEHAPPRHPVRSPSAPLYPRPAVGHPGRRPGAPARPHPAVGRAALAPGPAARLRLSPALSAGRRPLQDRTAGPQAGQRRQRFLPCRGGRAAGPRRGGRGRRLNGPSPAAKRLDYVRLRHAIGA